MVGRILAIGDIHGCSAALKAVLQACQPGTGDLVVTLGDYIDRGPDSRGTIDQLMELAQRCRLVSILGNHDEMLLAILAGHRYLMESWLSFGGDETLASYGATVPEEIPAAHVEFLKQCLPWYETDGHIFLHACYVPRLAMKKQPAEVLRWTAIGDPPPRPHRSRKIVVVGHTSQKSGEILDLGYLKCIDTRVYDQGWLTALDVQSGRIWQADKAGKLRE